MGELGYHCQTGIHREAELWSSQMAALAKIVSRASETQSGVEALKSVAIFCGVGLVVSLLLPMTGLDFSVGFF